MRNFSVVKVILTRDAAALVEPKILEDVHKQGLSIIVCDPTYRETDRQIGNIIGIGFSANDLWLHSVVDIYFHVGDATNLECKIGVTIPLTDQKGIGIRNVLSWAQATRSTPQAIANHWDVALHAQHCANQYQDAEHIAKMESTCQAVAADLISAFPEVQVVLGTGFPFYCMVRLDQPFRAHTPASILYYTATQADFFRRKFVPLDVLPKHETTTHRRFTPEQLLALGSNVGQTAFNAYEYRRWGVEPPISPPIGTLDEYVEANTLEIKERDWPCHLCTTLHNSSRFPEQAWERDFMISCLQCKQTSFLPRAVGVLGSDIDLVALASSHHDSTELAKRIAQWIDAHPHYYRHDTRWNVQLEGEHGPLDVFVSTTDKFLAAATQIAESEDWMSVTLDSAVTWLPITRLKYELGKYMPLCMEVLRDGSVPGPAGFTHQFNQVRRRFATRVTAEQVLSDYKQDSEYLQQLASNKSIARILVDRFSLWRDEMNLTEA